MLILSYERTRGNYKRLLTNVPSTDLCKPRTIVITLSAGTKKYTDRFNVEEKPHEQVSWYDTKQSDGKVPVMLELWGLRSTSSLPSLPGPNWPGVVALDRVQSMDLVELNCALMINWIVWNGTVFDIETVYLC